MNEMNFELLFFNILSIFESKNNIYFPVTFYEVILDCPSVIAAILAGQLCRPLGILSII